MAGRAFGIVAIKASVVHTVGLSAFNMQREFGVSAKNNGETLVERWC